MPIYGICVCNVVTVWVKRYMWEACGDSHAVTIQWVHMGVDPLLCVSSNIITIIWPLVETHSLKDRMLLFYNLTSLDPPYLGMLVFLYLCLLLIDCVLYLPYLACHLSVEQLAEVALTHLHKMAKTKDHLNHKRMQLETLKQLDKELSVQAPTSQPSATMSLSVAPPPYNVKGGSAEMQPMPAPYNDSNVHRRDINESVTDKFYK